ncbi:MAG: malto-oligosyltrehalose synthase, partial [Chthoniobacteraceae bacterium]
MSSFVPTATYRFQFNKTFTFQAARELVGYLHDLGITHVYASPFFRAAPGSMHGYDVCDHNELNPEIGTRADFDAFASELKSRDMRLIVDFVPNHMGIGEPQNWWWMDVLENGPSSPYARFFDIDWEPLKNELANKVLLPILGDQYGRVLERGELRIEFSDGAFTLNYYENCLPLGPRTVRPILQRAAEFLDPTPPELVSIITALDYLPPANETAPEKIEERAREKQIIRERLTRLCAESSEVETTIRRAISEWQDVSDPQSLDRLDDLVTAQPYRLAYWRVAAEEINYRRFFDINTLAAIRMELPEVFDAAHQLLLELIGTGVVDGVRIDHIDGLAHPREYLATLQEKAARVLEQPSTPHAIYLLVEKILGHGEQLRVDWPCHGTTGYEVGAQITRVLTDPRTASAMTDCYQKFIGQAPNYRDLIYETKSLVMHVSMSSEVNALAHLLNRLSECHRWYRDFTVNSLTTAVREIIACFPVYRTYIMPDLPAQESDARVVNYAIAQARRRNPAIERSIFDFLRDVLMPPDPNPHPVDEDLRQSFVLKFQQCTGPITAKGVEDTAFYVYNRLVSLNEVGGEPDIFGSTVEEFHEENVSRLAAFPHCMVATSTHDTKRAEDVRARITALSELPDEWARSVFAIIGTRSCSPLARVNVSCLVAESTNGLTQGALKYTAFSSTAAML